MVDATIDAGSDYDFLFVPGADSALVYGQDPALQDWLRQTATKAERVMGVCIGTILLRMCGLLDGRKATTNKLDFNDTVPLARSVDWVKQARWVRDGKYYTSSGLSAGIDMAFAVIAYLYGQAVAEEFAIGCEYEWHQDANRDPFAKLAGLV